ncbi:MAG: exodeoxyribonuclease VII large subunit [Chloroflexota bacterium]|nr:exodeoxyribonuclease VII large subunit [Chloroflexota bacterium]
MLIHSISQLTSYVRERLEQDLVLSDIWVSGEISNLAQPGSGHSYFTLKDDRNSMRCVMFRSAGSPDGLANGASVVTHGRMSMYEVRGEVQLLVDIVQPQGTGELQLRLEQLKLKLDREGLFELSRKRSLPIFPKKIGVVTSPTGAVWQDIQNVISRRYPLVELKIAPALVQGADAVPTIVEALESLVDTDVEVIIVARGGGSLEDLWPFNEEQVARAVYASPVAVISAIGHETDVTVVDMVADVRAPTPSAAAEVAVPDMNDILNNLFSKSQYMSSMMSTLTGTYRNKIENSSDRILISQPDIDTIRRNIDASLETALTHINHDIQIKKEQIKATSGRLGSLNPKEILRRGYAIIQKHGDTSVLGPTTSITIGDSLDITAVNKNIGADVTSVSPIENHDNRSP